MPPVHVRIIHLPELSPLVRQPDRKFRPWIEGDPPAKFALVYPLTTVRLGDE